MKLHIWTDEVSYLAVCHAETVAEARELLKVEVGYNDGSCPEREKAWRHITGNTSAPYNGRVAAFCLSGSSEVREQLAYSEKVVSERDTLRAELAAALEASGANAKAWQDCVEESAIKRTHLMAEIGLTEQQRDAATARAEKAEAEAAALRAHVERMRKALDGPQVNNVLGLIEDCSYAFVWSAALAFMEFRTGILAATPAQSLAACKAEALSAMAQKLTAMNDHPIVLHVAHIVQEDADKLQAEAVNGTT